MRRMLTEKDVDKIDSIDPADIETLKAIDPTDIEKLKATGSPKGATYGYVLTADGKGRASYQYKQTGNKIHWENWQSFSQTGLTTDDDGNKCITIQGAGENTAICFGGYLNGSIKANGVAIPLAESILMPYKVPRLSGFRIYFSDDTITKYNLTAETQFTGQIRYSYFYN